MKIYSLYMRNLSTSFAVVDSFQQAKDICFMLFAIRFPGVIPVTQETNANFQLSDGQDLAAFSIIENTLNKLDTEKFVSICTMFQEQGM